MSWTRGGNGWTEVFDGAARKLGNVSRLAISPAGDALAIVYASRRGASDGVMTLAIAAVVAFASADTVSWHRHHGGGPGTTTGRRPLL